MATLKLEIEVPVFCTCGHILEPAGKSDGYITVKPCLQCMDVKYLQGYYKRKEEANEHGPR